MKENSFLPIRGLAMRLSLNVDQMLFADLDTFWHSIHKTSVHIWCRILPWSVQCQCQFWPQCRTTSAGPGCPSCHCHWHSLHWSWRTPSSCPRSWSRWCCPRCCYCWTPAECLPPLKFNNLLRTHFYTLYLRSKLSLLLWSADLLLRFSLKLFIFTFIFCLLRLLVGQL